MIPQLQPCLGPLNHIAVAVPDIEAAAERYRQAFGVAVPQPVDLPEHGVTVAFVDCGQTRIELLQPLGEDSPIRNFLKRNPQGGLHHICHDVPDIEAARRHLDAIGIRILGDGRTRIGSHGKPVLFLHPKDCNGVLVELQQA